MGIASRVGVGEVEKSRSREVDKSRIPDTSTLDSSTSRLLDSSTRKAKAWVPRPLPQPSKSKESEREEFPAKQPLLDSRRRSELAGFLVAVAGLLVLLSLASFVPEDPSLNTATAAGATARNWIGPVGAYTADLLFQGFGWVAYLIPMVLLVVGARLLLVRPFAAPKTKAVGAGLLVTSLSALLEILPLHAGGPGADPRQRHAGLSGGGRADPHVQSGGRRHCCRHGVPVFAVSRHPLLFLLGGGILEARWEVLAQPFAARWKAWQEARAAAAAERRRRQAERARRLGKPPVITQRVATSQAAPIVTKPQPSALRRRRRTPNPPLRASCPRSRSKLR